jgi:hypothetical protein
MTIEVMFSWIREVWALEESKAELEKAKAEYPDLYEEALAMAHEASLNQY